MSRSPKDFENFEQFFQLFQQTPASQLIPSVDLPGKRSTAITVGDWLVKGVLAPCQAWQWGRLVFAVMQLLQERSPLIPEVIVESTPPVLVGIAGYTMNALVTLALADLAACIQVCQQLTGEIKQSKKVITSVKSAFKCIFTLFFIACGVLYYWPVVGDPTPLSNQSFPVWKSGYDVFDKSPVASWVNRITYAIANTLIMGPSGFYLAHMLTEMAAHFCDKSEQVEKRRIEEQLTRLMWAPDLRFWYEHVRAANTRPDSLNTLVEGVNPKVLALAALYADNRQPSCVRAVEKLANLACSFILNYGFIPFTLLVFDTLKSWPSFLSAFFSLAATATNFMLTLSLASEISGFLKSLSPCRSQPIGLALTAASLFVASAFILYFSSMIYLPDVFKESIADCAYTEGVDNITFGNVTITCPDNSALWFDVQFILAISNPFLYNLSVLMQLSKKVYKAIAACLASRHQSHQEAFLWNQFQDQSVKKLQLASQQNDFLADFAATMLSASDDSRLADLFCAFVYDGLPVCCVEKSQSAAGPVLRQVAGGKEITLPTGFDSIQPFKLGCWKWVYWLKELPVIAVSIYYWNSYDQENSSNPTPHLPKLGDGLTAFIVLAGVWVSSIIPLLIDFIRMRLNKTIVLSIYQENSKRWCGRNDRAFGLVRPILNPWHYVGWQGFAALLSVPLLVGSYHLAVAMLEAAIELDLHALTPQVESITAMAFQAFVLAAIAGLVRQFQDSVLQLGLTARCNRRVSSTDTQFPSKRFLPLQQDGTYTDALLAPSAP